jgi:hypothetical protein
MTKIFLSTNGAGIGRQPHAKKFASGHSLLRFLKSNFFLKPWVIQGSYISFFFSFCFETGSLCSPGRP